jgi:hypothetical protein
MKCAREMDDRPATKQTCPELNPSFMNAKKTNVKGLLFFLSSPNRYHTLSTFDVRS